MNSDLASTAIGQGAISVTPIQVLTAINTIANDGAWIKPTILKVNSNNQNLKTKVKILEPKIAKAIQKMLAESVAANIKDKHANSGKVEGLSIAGKTGTAQKLENGRYSGYRTVASFIGFFPAEKPQYISLVVIDDPKTDGGWGDTVAGPLFNQVANYCRYL
jgi:cell division protein FtsI/penicillin-binding protein 2